MNAIYLNDTLTGATSASQLSEMEKEKTGGGGWVGLGLGLADVETGDTSVAAATLIMIVHKQQVEMSMAGGWFKPHSYLGMELNIRLLKVNYKMYSNSKEMILIMCISVFSESPVKIIGLAWIWMRFEAN